MDCFKRDILNQLAIVRIVRNVEAQSLRHLFDLKNNEHERVRKGRNKLGSQSVLPNCIIFLP